MEAARDGFSAPDPTMSDALDRYLSELEELLMQLHRTSRAMVLASELTTLQLVVVHHLVTDGASSMTDLASFLGVRPQSVTPVIDSLERAKLVRRTRSARDRRRTIIVTTGRARRLSEAMHARLRRLLRASLRDRPSRPFEEAAATLRATREALVRAAP